MAANGEIWVVAATWDSEGMRFISQLISKAAELSEGRYERVRFAAVGGLSERDFEIAAEHGAGKALVCESDGQLDDESYASVVADMINTYLPTLTIFPATAFGKAAAARISAQFECGLTADCLDVDLDDKYGYVFTRAAINDSVLAHIVCVNSKVMMCTAKENAFADKPVDHAKPLSVEVFPPGLPKRQPSISVISSRARASEAGGGKLASAKLIFALGRGARAHAEELRGVAKKYGAQIVGTRAVVEEGLLSQDRQVGQSGASVSPNVYVCFGVSGAAQHVAGIRNARTVVAVNTDASAPIFAHADYAVVGDAVEIIRKLRDI